MTIVYLFFLSNMPDLNVPKNLALYGNFSQTFLENVKFE